MASCLDDGLGTGQASQGEIELSPRTRKSQELRLGRLEKTLPQAPQQQKIQGHRLIPQVGRGRRWFLDQRRFHRRNFEKQIPQFKIGNERCR